MIFGTCWNIWRLEKINPLIGMCLVPGCSRCWVEATMVSGFHQRSEHFPAGFWRPRSLGQSVLQVLLKVFEALSFYGVSTGQNVRLFRVWTRKCKKHRCPFPIGWLVNRGYTKPDMIENIRADLSHGTTATGMPWQGVDECHISRSMCQEPPGLRVWIGSFLGPAVEELLVDSGRKVRGICRMWRISFAWPGYVSCAVWQTALQLGYQKCETMKGEKWDGLLVCASNLVCGFKLFIIHILYIYIHTIIYIYIYT